MEDADPSPHRPRPAQGRGVLRNATTVACLLAAVPLVVEVRGSLEAVWAGSALLVLLAVAAEAAGFMATWRLQAMLLGADRLADVAVPQLAGNALSNVVPGGSAAGALAQLRLLRDRGFDTATAGTALAASGLLGSVTALVVFPLLLLAPLGSMPEGVGDLAAVGAASCLALLTLLVATLRSDRPLLAVVRVAGRLARWLRRPVPDDLGPRVLAERDVVRGLLARRTATVGVLCVGRLVGDYLGLYAAVLAAGGHPAPAAVLVAYVTANAAGMVPITPGGLGFVEAGLAGALVLTGVAGGQVAVAVAVYRLASCWLPVAAGGLAWAFAGRRGAPTGLVGGPAPAEVEVAVAALAA